MIYARRGQKGAHVVEWQNFLIAHGYYDGAPDGDFGPRTEEATRDFQREANLDDDGIVGNDTLEAAQELGFKLPVEGEIDFSRVQDFTTRVRRPAQTNRPGLSGASNTTMLNVLGVPCIKSIECTTPTNKRLKELLVIKNVGPFRVQGIRPAVESLERVLGAVKAKMPVLYNQLGTEGMFCCRLVRGSETSYSNHSWGTAIDIKVNKVLDRFADGYVQLGTLALAPFFNDEMFYWGAGFSREDGMHYEASEQLIKKWHQSGII